MTTAGLIEKAAGGLPRAATDAPRARAIAPEQIFDVDFDALAACGLFAPGERASALALELRAVKRRLLRRIGFLRAGGGPGVARRSGRQRNLILVASTRPGEGKTFTAINLALSFAHEDGIDVLLVDADTPRPKVMSHFGLNAGARGLLDRLADPALSVDGLMVKARGAGLSILPEGRPDAGAAAELYASEEAKRFFTEISSHQPDRLVIIDSPPVLASADAVLLARHVDEVVFVVEADATPEPAVAAAVDELLDVNPNVSLLLNRCLIGGGGSHYGSYKDYYPEERRRNACPPRPRGRSDLDLRAVARGGPGAADKGGGDGRDR
ncbi:MAG: AAA family ATPase [Parvularculaceae bacterium]